MRPRWILLLALLVALAPGARAEVSPVQKLNQRMSRVRNGDLRFDAKVAEDLRALVADVRLIWAVEPEREAEIARALLDVAGAFADADATTGPGPASAAAVRDAAEEALRAHVDSDFATWLAREIIPAASQPLERRLAGCGS